MTILEQSKLVEAYKKVSESENFDVMELIRKNPEAIEKLKSGEINAGDLADQAQFIQAKAKGIDPVASTNSVPYQLLKKTANITQRKLQSGGEFSALDYAERAKASAEYNTNQQNRYINSLPVVNTPDPVGAKQDAASLTQAATGKSIEQIQTELNENDKQKFDIISEAKEQFKNEFGMSIENAFKKKCC